jgi:hypothetical protein
MAEGAAFTIIILPSKDRGKSTGNRQMILRRVN